jgi:hypothetical protein
MFFVAMRSDVLTTLGELLEATRLEICLFLVEILACFLFLGNDTPKSKKGVTKKSPRAIEKELDQGAQLLTSHDHNEAETSSLLTALEKGVHRDVFAGEKLPKVNIAYAVEAMQRCR